MTSRFQVLLVAAACSSGVACAPKLMKLPAVGGPPAADVHGALADATSACRQVTTLSAEVAVSGSIADQGIRGRLLVGVAAPASARIEAVAPFGQPIFIFVTRGRDATLLLPRDQRVLEHGAPAAVLEAVAGVALDAEELRRVLAGCPAVDDVDAGRAPSDDWRVIRNGPDEVYLHREPNAARWQMVALLHQTAERSGWRAEYRDFQDGLPRAIRLVSIEPKRFDLRLALTQVDVNVRMADEVFRVEVPRAADPITIDELREVGPFARQGVRKD